MFVPFYYIFWTYKTAQLTDQLAREKGLASDMATLCLILAIFVGIIPPILLQDKLNNIVAVEQGLVAPETPAAAYAPAAAPAAAPKNDLGVAEELKTYKELLDTGAITQEEYDAKKKQLLGL
ncbi:MAG: SHOCT domain-containing protein [Clostridiales bacterium]|nr:SHOCT domain-containing protein [Clostridiales bacterium]MBQ3107240.1 SHOCT domain-containing protein [Bacillota bacterium]